MNEQFEIELPRLKHQHWSLAGMFYFSDGEFLDQSRLQSDYEYDGILAMKTPNIVWAELATLVRNRHIVLEHFSRSIDVWDFLSSKGKFYGYSREQFRRGMKRPARAPCLLMIAHSYPRNVVKLAGLKKHPIIQGVYISGTPDFDTVILVVTTQLPADSKYNWLRLCSRAPEMDELPHVKEQLMKVRELSRNEVEHLTEATMIIEAFNGKSIPELAREQVRLEYELKERDDREARAAQSIAELAREQVRLEYELKERDEREARAAQSIAELAREQVRLEYELKERDDREARAAQSIAELAREQVRLEYELKETEERAQNSIAELAREQARLELELEEKDRILKAALRELETLRNSSS